jgi:hypothetical protein
MPTIDFTDEELGAIIAALRERIDREWRYRMAARLEPFRTALVKLDPNAPQIRSVATLPPLPRAGRIRGTGRH